MIENNTFYDFLLICIFSGIITLTVMIGNLFALIFTSAGILHLVSQGQNMLSFNRSQRVAFYCSLEDFLLLLHLFSLRTGCGVLVLLYRPFSSHTHL